MAGMQRIMGLACAVVLTTGTVGLFAGGALAAQDNAGKVTVTSSVEPRETRSYKVDVAVKGSMPVAGSKELADLDVIYSLKIRHKYGRREKDGMLPLEISVTDAEITAGGQRLSVLPNTFPKITVLLDRDWNVSEVFGLAGTSYAKSVPGINYGNLIVLFYLYGAQTPHSVGDKWNYKVKFPAYKETYDFTTDLQSVEQVNGADYVRVHDDVAWTPKQPDGQIAATPTAAVERTFAVRDGKLMKSHADCKIVFAAQQDSASAEQDHAPSRANIRIDISLIK